MPHTNGMVTMRAPKSITSPAVENPEDMVLTVRSSMPELASEDFLVLEVDEAGCFLFAGAGWCSRLAAVPELPLDAACAPFFSLARESGLSVR